MTRLVFFFNVLLTLAGLSLARESSSSESTSWSSVLPPASEDEPDRGAGLAGASAYEYTKPDVPHANASQGELYDYWSTLVGKESPGVARLGPCTKPTAAALAADLAASEGESVKKTVFGGPTLLYVAGLEGAGHHFWMSMHNESLESAPPAIDNSLRELMHARRMVCGEAGAAATTCRSPPPGWLDGPRRALARALGEFRALPRGVYSAGPGFWSYPFHRDGPRAAFEHPDLRVLAELAEQAGVDVRFLVTTRSAEGMIKSDVSHRHFCAGPDAMERQADYLTHNANVLKAQLQRVDKRFFVHSSFDELPELAPDLVALYETKLSLPHGAWQDRAKHVYTRHTKRVGSFISLEGLVFMDRLLAANNEMVRIAKAGPVKDEDPLVVPRELRQQSIAGH